MGISKCQASLWLSDHSRVSVSMNENDKSKLLNLNFHIVRFFQVDQIPILSKHFHGTFRYSKLLCLIRSTDRADRTLDWRPKKFEIYDKSLHCLSLCQLYKSPDLSRDCVHELDSKLLYNILCNDLWWVNKLAHILAFVESLIYQA